MPLIGCPHCGNLCTCTCKIQREHSEGCRYRRAAQMSVELACDHGFQACPICDPCTCPGINREDLRGIR